LYIFLQSWHCIFPPHLQITNSEVRVRKAVSFEDDKHVVGSSKSPSLPLDPPYPAPGLKGSSDPPPSRERKIISSGRQAFTGSIIERDDNLLPIQPPGGSSFAKPGTSASSRPMSRFKMQMQKGGRWLSTPGWIFVAGTCIWDSHDKPYCQYCTLYARNLSDQDSSTLYPLAEHLGRKHVFVVLIVECTFSETVCGYMACSVKLSVMLLC